MNKRKANTFPPLIEFQRSCCPVGEAPPTPELICNAAGDAGPEKESGERSTNTHNGRLYFFFSFAQKRFI